MLQCVTAPSSYMSMSQYVAVCCGMLQCVAAPSSYVSMSQCVAVCCGTLQCVTACCSVLQHQIVTCQRVISHVAMRQTEPYVFVGIFPQIRLFDIKPRLGVLDAGTHTQTHTQRCVCVTHRRVCVTHSLSPKHQDLHTQTRTHTRQCTHTRVRVHTRAHVTHVCITQKHTCT